MLSYFISPSFPSEYLILFTPLPVSLIFSTAIFVFWLPSTTISFTLFTISPFSFISYVGTVLSINIFSTFSSVTFPNPVPYILYVPLASTVNLHSSVFFISHVLIVVFAFFIYIFSIPFVPSAFIITFSFVYSPLLYSFLLFSSINFTCTFNGILSLHNSLFVLSYSPHFKHTSYCILSFSSLYAIT